MAATVHFGSDRIARLSLNARMWGLLCFVWLPRDFVSVRLGMVSSGINMVLKYIFIVI